MPGEPARSLVARLALEKALSVSKKFSSQWIVGADTVVAYKGQIFGKPRNREEAWRMLMALRGNSHWVLTGVALVREGRRPHKTHVEKTKVTFKNFPMKSLGDYIQSQEPFDKAGGYDIQGRARFWVQEWKGDFFNIMGLPAQWLVHQIHQ
jgi:septum formation protein